MDEENTRQDQETLQQDQAPLSTVGRVCSQVLQVLMLARQPKYDIQQSVDM